jgi:hypothetical protein
MLHVKATSGASRAARGSTGTLAAHGAGEERRGRRRPPNRLENVMEMLKKLEKVAKSHPKRGEEKSQRFAISMW